MAVTIVRIHGERGAVGRLWSSGSGSGLVLFLDLGLSALFPKFSTPKGATYFCRNIQRTFHRKELDEFDVDFAFKGSQRFLTSQVP
ncbi:hypothetical protein Tco_0397665 [Tanacetum coccineum]